MKDKSDEIIKKSPPWNKGLTKETDEKIKRISESKIGKKRSTETINKMSKAMSGENHPFYGTHRTENTKQKISKAKLSKNPDELHTIFTEDCKQVLFGSLLGDGSLSHGNGRNYYLEETHSSKQKNYLAWKNTFLSVFNSKLRNKECINHKLNKKYPQVVLKTSSFPILSEYRQEFYLDGRKRITSDILNKINELGLTVWYMDDGHVTAIESLVNFSTDSFTYLEHQIMNYWFIKKWDVHPRIHKRNSTYYIKFGGKDSKKLLAIFKATSEKFKIPECMFYKLGQLWEGNKDRVKLLREKKNNYKREWRRKRRDIQNEEKSEKLKEVGECIKRMYCNEYLTLSEIGKHLGYSHSGIIKLMNKLNIPRRTTQETKKLRNHP